MRVTIAAPGRVRRPIAPARTSRRLAERWSRGYCSRSQPLKSKYTVGAPRQERRRLASRRIETDCRMPSAMHTDSSDEPPCEMNGSGMPVTA